MQSLKPKSLQPTYKELYRTQFGAAMITLKAAGTAIGTDHSEESVCAEGDLDFRGTLGVSGEVPAGFESIRCTSPTLPMFPLNKW